MTPPSYLIGAIIVLKALAAVGGFYARGAFRPGDYLRTAWTSFGASYLLLVVADVLYPSPHAGAALTATALVVRGALVLASNAASVLASVMMARTFAETGLEPAGSRLSRRALDVTFFVVTLAIVGPSIFVDLRGVARGDLRAYSALASDIGDLVALSLVAPILRTTLALRGGRLVWPWLLLTATEMSWLLYDAAGTLLPLWNGDPGRFPYEELLRALACSLAFLAGVAQRQVVGVGALAAAPPARA